VSHAFSFFFFLLIGRIVAQAWLAGGGQTAPNTQIETPPTYHCALVCILAFWGEAHDPAGWVEFIVLFLWVLNPLMFHCLVGVVLGGGWIAVCHRNLGLEGVESEGW